MRQQNPPDHLGEAGNAYWHLVAAEYALGDDDLTLLSSACEMLDRAESARQTITSGGLIVVDRFGQSKPHPAVDIERQSRLAFVRIRRELALDVEPPASRGPLPRGYR